MSVPSDLPDIGSTAQRLRQNPRFDPLAAGIGPEDYFVWTRFDGATSLRDLILMTGLPTPRAVDIVRRLRTVGAILLPNERPEAVAARAPERPRAASPPPSSLAPPRRTTPGTGVRARGDTENPTIRVGAGAIGPEDVAAMAEDVDISVAERDRILTMHRLVKTGEALAILGVADAADKKAVKRAYFALSKEFHPDRFYGKRTGSFAARLTAIFEAITRAYAELTEDKPRARSSTGAPGDVARASSSPQDAAAELFDRACQAEVSGDHRGALALFAQALRIDAPARYLRRAARCGLAAGDATLALEYAKKAANLEPNDPSTARLLAAAYRGVGKLADAEEVLVLAMMIKTENDQLAKELQHDLAELRRLAALGASRRAPGS